MPVLLTENAAKEIATIIQKQDLDGGSICLRVGVKGGGCSGFSYLLDLTESQKDSDEEWSYSYPINGTVEASDAGNGEDADGAGDGDDADAGNGQFTVRVICDPKSYLYLNGTTIDFKDEIMGRGFVFQNPNATSTCGCGSSFSA